MNKLFYSIVLLLLTAACTNYWDRTTKIVSTEETITLVQDDSVIEFSIFKDEETPNMAGNKNYHWFYYDKLGITQGSYLGNLLDGNYTLHTRDKALLEKGNFEEGLKMGEWIQWYPTGNIRQVGNWKAGVREGNWLEFYENGELKKTAVYADDQLHGVVTYYQPDSTTTIETYDHGQLMQKGYTPEADSVDAEQP